MWAMRGRQHARLAGAGAGQHQHGPVERFDGLALLRVQPVEIARAEPRPGAIGDATGARGEVVVLRIFRGARPRHAPAAL